MKKFTSILMVALLALVGLSSQAKTLKFKTTEDFAGKIQLVDAGNGVNLTLTSISQTLENLPESGVATLQAAEGFNIGRISSVQANGSNGYTSDRTNYGENVFNLNWGMFSDGSTITVTAVEAASVEAKKLTFYGEPGSYYVSTSDYAEYRPDQEGKTPTFDYTYISSVTVYATEGYLIKSVRDQIGCVWVSNPTPTQYAAIKTKSMIGSLDMTVEVVKEADIEKNSFTVNVHDSNNDLYKVLLYDNKGKQYNIGSVNTEVNFEKSVEYFTVRNSYGRFYKVTQNTDNEISVNENGYYRFVPTAGDVIDIYMAFPEKEIPFNVTFTGSADQSIVTDFSYDNNYTVSLSSIISGEVKPMMGKNIFMLFDTEGFKNVAIKVNGEIQEDDARLNLTLTNEDGYDIEIYGERLEPYHVSIVTRDPEALIVYKGYTGTATYELTGQVTELDIDRSSNVLKFAAAEGFKISNIIVYGDNNYSYSGYDNSYTVRSDVEIEVETEAVVRDLTMTVYLDPNTEWNYVSFVLSNQDYALQKKVDLKPGYNQANYGDFDMPVNISLYPYGKVYLNDELIEGQYTSGGNYDATKDMPVNSVIKIYSEEQTKLNVSYTIAEGVSAKVVHDLATEIDTPSNHSVLPGTCIQISPVANDATRSASALDVKVNGEKAEADSEGVYTVYVTKDTNISVEAAEGSAVITVDAESGCDAIFNLNGVRVDGKHLPAGIYVKGRKKIVVK